jgi:hypothetical protein
MEKVFAVLKRVVTSLPYLSFLTAILYLAGRQFNASYWRGVGLPLMATDRQFADMLFDGFLGYLLWTGRFFGRTFSPVAVALIISFVLTVVYRLLEWQLTRLKAKRVARGGEPSIGLSPRAERILDEIEKSGGYFSTISLALLAVPLLIGMIALAPGVPLLAFGGTGFDEGRKELASYEARFKQLRDGLVDVSVVKVKRLDGGESVRAIPMECAGDRCAAMTADGPVSLPKDRFGEESIVRADLTDACFTPLGLVRRRAHATTEH